MKAERRKITFRMLKKGCKYLKLDLPFHLSRHAKMICIWKHDHCSAKNCPIWAKLREDAQ